MENKNFDFTKEPGNIKHFNKYSHKKVDVSIITAYFNASNYIFQTACSVLAQTFPNWEWIIVNDGSTELGTKKTLSKLAKLDTRIKILNQKNSGPAVARDYGIKNAIGDFVLILDADDLIDKTFLECAYWSLLSNPDASWSYSDQVGFGSKEYLWTQKFDVQKQKSENLLCICSLIKKTALITSGGYSYTKNSFHEDWKLWLQMLSKNYFPVKMNFFGFWYRNRNGRLKTALENPEKRQIAINIIHELSQNISNDIQAVNYPKENNNKLTIQSLNIPTFHIRKFIKKNLLFILPTSSFNLEHEMIIKLLKRLSKKFNIYVVTTEQLEYPLRQEYEMYSTIFDLTTFIDKNLWMTFINYLVNTRKINFVFQKDNLFTFENIKTMSYTHSLDKISEGYNDIVLYEKITLNIKNIIYKNTCIVLQNIVKCLKKFLKKFKFIRKLYIRVKKDEQ